jgi:hypothetical protein
VRIRRDRPRRGFFPGGRRRDLDFDDHASDARQGRYSPLDVPLHLLGRGTILRRDGEADAHDVDLDPHLLHETERDDVPAHAREADTLQCFPDPLFVRTVRTLRTLQIIRSLRTLRVPRSTINRHPFRFTAEHLFCALGSSERDPCAALRRDRRELRMASGERRLAESPSGLRPDQELRDCASAVIPTGTIGRPLFNAMKIRVKRHTLPPSERSSSGKTTIDAPRESAERPNRSCPAVERPCGRPG